MSNDAKAAAAQTSAPAAAAAPAGYPVSRVVDRVYADDYYAGYRRADPIISPRYYEQGLVADSGVPRRYAYASDYAYAPRYYGSSAGCRQSDIPCTTTRNPGYYAGAPYEYAAYGGAPYYGGGRVVPSVTRYGYGGYVPSGSVTRYASAAGYVPASGSVTRYTTAAGYVPASGSVTRYVGGAIPASGSVTRYTSAAGYVPASGSVTRYGGYLPARGYYGGYAGGYGGYLPAGGYGGRYADGYGGYLTAGSYGGRYAEGVRYL